MTELHEAIINDTGIGNIKDYTPKYKFIIPYFDIATWHDYMEENFRSIDALFNYIYEIKQYRGKWKQLTKVNVDDVYFIDDDEDPLNGRLVKVLVEHTTDDTAHFSDYYNAHQSYYEIFDDASAAQVYASEAKQYKNEAESAKTAAQQSATSAEQYKDLASVFRDDALHAKNSAITSANNAQTSEQNTKIYEQYTEGLVKKVEEVYTFCPFIQYNLKLSNNVWKVNDDPRLSEQTRSLYKYVYKQTNDFVQKKIDEEYINKHDISGLITFSTDDVLTGNFCPTALFEMSISNTNSLLLSFHIYAKEIPQGDITLPSALFYCKEKQYGN